MVTLVGMRIIGIDPGLATTGVGIIDSKGNKHQAVFYDAIITKPKQDMSKRLVSIYHQLSDIIRDHSPDTMAVETLFFNTNVTTAMAVSQARGVMLLTAELFNIPVSSYTPPQVKTGVSGYGRATKKQVQEMVKRLLCLDKVPKPDDVADALAVAICHSHSHRIQSYS